MRPPFENKYAHLIKKDIRNLRSFKLFTWSGLILISYFITAFIDDFLDIEILIFVLYPGIAIILLPSALVFITSSLSLIIDLKEMKSRDRISK
ncbi:hypothetical protein [Marinigracilibium pacificum]|uniref:Uncharacterized protein n=1 Tax=Marinigracilibium pacificum TaxID=2729599 RepID=A0A848J0F2_9BACT|nr:hypothetical protein [Marinigracilibium pacificum]NMM47749.1 hypothetical protein [Marinigracilibium pacificum]